MPNEDGTLTPEELDTYIENAVASVVFEPAKVTESVINVPLYVPKILFDSDMIKIKGYAMSMGWDPEQVEDAVGPLQFIMQKVRLDVKQKFNRFVQLSAIAQAKTQAQQQIDDLGLGE